MASRRRTNSVVRIGDAGLRTNSITLGISAHRRHPRNTPAPSGRTLGQPSSRVGWLTTVTVDCLWREHALQATRACEALVIGGNATSVPRIFIRGCAPQLLCLANVLTKCAPFPCLLDKGGLQRWPDK